MAYDSGKLVAAVIEEARKIFSDKSIKNEGTGDNHNRQTDDSAAAFKQNDDSDNTDCNIKRRVGTGTADDLLKIDDVIRPAARSDKGKDYIIKRKCVFGHGLCGREKQECKELHESKVAGPDNLGWNTAAQSGIKLESTKSN